MGSQRAGIARILVFDDGDDSIAVFRGAGSGLSAAHAQAVTAPLGACRVVMASCAVPRECTAEAFRIAGAGAGGALTLRTRGSRAVLLTLGAAGCRLYRPGDSAGRVAVAGHRRQVVDTIGAGDTFTGSLAAALARGVPLPDAMRWAHAAAALAVRGRSAIGGMPMLAEVAALLA